MEFLRKLSKEFFKALLAIIILAVGMHLFNLYKEAPIRNFCNQIIVGSSVDSIIEKANQENFVVFNTVKEHGHITILNQRSFAWRFSCKIDIENNKSVSITFSPAD